MPLPRWKLFLVGICFLCPQLSHAWGRAGHETVALIAEDRIDKSTREKIHALLGPKVSLADISTCSDDIKRRFVNCAGAFPVKRSPSTGPWHYIDIPITASPTVGSLQDYCPKDDCVVNQIADQVKVLLDPRAVRLAKQVALMHLVHFVGDIHQPLHCADDHDAGGNGKKVYFTTGRPLKNPMNLHHLWDNILYRDSAVKKLDPRDLARRLEKDMGKKNTDVWRKDSSHQWALESFDISKRKIYPDYKEGWGKNMDEDYLDAARLIAEERIEQAGVRLANLLDKTLGAVSIDSLTRQSPPEKTSPKTHIPDQTPSPKGGPLPLPGRR